MEVVDTLERAAGPAAKSIKVGFDAASMFKTLRFAFGKCDTVVQELLQNSRRAGASRIDVQYDAETKTLVVTDNGCGLEDFGVLTHFCVSGWNEATKEVEKPYGIGFLACFYSGSRVCFSSKGQEVSIASQDLLDSAGSDRAFAVSAGSVHEGAVVRIEGFAWDDAGKRLLEMVSGFPVPVWLNGEELPRPHALSSAFKPSSIGHVRFTHKTPLGCSAYEMDIFLQGFRVRKASGTRMVVVHLDSTKFHGKFPDRQTVVDEDKMLAAVVAGISGLVKEDLLSAKQAMDPLQFCLQRHGQAKSIRSLEVFNDIDVVPQSWLADIEALPIEACESDVDGLGVDGLGDTTLPTAFVSKADMEAGRYQIADLEQPSAGDPASMNPWNLAFAANMLVVRVQLHHEHWIRNIGRLTLDSEVGFEVVRARANEVRLEGEGAYLTLIPCEKVIFHCGDVRAEARTSVGGFVDDCIYLPDGAEIDARALRQCSSYKDEWGSFDDGPWDNDECLFYQKAREALEPDPKQRMLMEVRAALDVVRCRPPGVALRVEVTADNRLEVSALDA